MLNYEKKFYSSNVHLIAGTDEAGRGPICGPVAAAAVIFKEDYFNEEINDSKKITAKKRKQLESIIKKDALAYAIVMIDAETIDKINIYAAAQKAMHDALNKLQCQYDLVLTDAMPLPNEKHKVIPIIKGDAKALCIAAASILAKVARDEYMDKLDKKYPNYQFAKHKGYYTALHAQILEKYGPIKGIYRYSTKPVKNKLSHQLNFLEDF